MQFLRFSNLKRINEWKAKESLDKTKKFLRDSSTAAVFAAFTPPNTRHVQIPPCNNAAKAAKKAFTEADKTMGIKQFHKHGR